MLKDLLSKRLEYSAVHWDGVEFHSGEQDASVLTDKADDPVTRSVSDY